MMINNERWYDLIQIALSYGIEGSNKTNNYIEYKTIRATIKTSDSDKQVTISYEKDNTSITIYNKHGFIHNDDVYIQAIELYFEHIIEEIKRIEDAAIETVKSEYGITSSSGTSSSTTSSTGTGTSSSGASTSTSTTGTTGTSTTGTGSSTSSSGAGTSGTV